MLYSTQIETRFRDPHFAGNVTGRALTARAATPGSSAVLQINLVVENELIQRAGFQAFGCPPCIAAGDWACEWLTGRALSETSQLTAAMIESALDLEPAKRHVALLVEDVLAQIATGNSEQTKLSY